MWRLGGWLPPGTTMRRSLISRAEPPGQVPQQSTPTRRSFVCCLYVARGHEGRPKAGIIFCQVLQHTALAGQRLARMTVPRPQLATYCGYAYQVHMQREKTSHLFLLSPVRSQRSAPMLTSAVHYVRSGPLLLPTCRGARRGVCRRLPTRTSR